MYLRSWVFQISGPDKRNGLLKLYGSWAETTMGAMRRQPYTFWIAMYRSQKVALIGISNRRLTTGRNSKITVSTSRILWGFSITRSGWFKNERCSWMSSEVTSMRDMMTSFLTHLVLI